MQHRQSKRKRDRTTHSVPHFLPRKPELDFRVLTEAPERKNIAAIRTTSLALETATILRVQNRSRIQGTPTIAPATVHQIVIHQAVILVDRRISTFPHMG